MNHRFIVVLCLFLMGCSSTAPEFTLRGDIESRFDLDVSRIQNAAQLYRGTACVAIWALVVPRNGPEFEMSRDFNCELFEGFVRFGRVDSRLESELHLRTQRAVTRAVNVAGKWGALICITFAVDFVDRRERPGNFTESACYYEGE